jgi:uncharacterized protein (TIGR00251 family)
VRRRGAGRGDGRRAAFLSLVAVRLQPRAGRDEIVGERDGRILVRVSAAPLEGAANAALCKLIAKRLRVARGRVAVVRGERNRDKTVRVEGLAADDVRRRLLA